ncbi:Protein of unknown function DUF247, plant [Dillenia turbinata]|uniref:Uncharacterized protein n=1 Tax=Dillenia turbinata TaxID=194707 RepID=A0AAN8Z7M5_9MAGN
MIFSLIFSTAKLALKSILLAFARLIPSREGEKLVVKFKLVNYSTDLAEKGVKFKNNEYGNCRIFDVDFVDGCLIIPKLVVKSHSEAIFLNLLAYERHCASDPRFVSDYMALMECLINSSNDVDLLCQCGIFENLSHDKGEITKLFDMPKDNFIVINQNKFVCSKIFQWIDDHCRHPWTRFMLKLSQWMTTLCDKYFRILSDLSLSTRTCCCPYFQIPQLMSCEVAQSQKPTLAGKANHNQCGSLEEEQDRCEVGSSSSGKMVHCMNSPMQIELRFMKAKLINELDGALSSLPLALLIILFLMT